MGWRTKKHILVVEDNQEVQNVLSRTLNFLVFEVVLADNSVEALAVFIENRFDLVLTDLQMPAMDGSRLAQLVKERSPNTTVILLTGTDGETVRKKVTDGSVDPVIFKPFKVNGFQSAVVGALASGRGEQRSLGV
jgi:CheY-like chemotaxis protein